MSKLWDKGYQLDNLIEKFTVGDDYLLDRELIYYDCVGSIAHAAMLMQIAIITQDEFEQLKEALLLIIQHAQTNTFSLSLHDEDVHTAVENWLVKHVGVLGKKLHTARSRNDQVLLDMRLYMRDSLMAVAHGVLNFCEMLLSLAQKHTEVPVAGRTHFQRAMPSSFGLFWGAYAESLLDNVQLIQSAYTLVNQCPLGSAASYGVTLPIDRQLVADLLGFASVQNNVLYVNNSRGKIESIVINTLVQIMMDLSKLCSDLIIFSAPEFGYITLPQELCSGSSLMPQKKNPCVLELIRAKSALVIGHLMQTLTLIRALPSGYNRDFQETKRPLMESFSIVGTCLEVGQYTLQKVGVNYDACFKSVTPELFATDEVLRLVKAGYPFRDAYKKVAQNNQHSVGEDPLENIRAKTHQGATGNLGLDRSYSHISTYRTWVERTQEHYKSALNILIHDDVKARISREITHQRKGTNNGN